LRAKVLKEQWFCVIKPMRKWHVVTVAVVPLVTVGWARLAFFKCKTVHNVVLPLLDRDNVTKLCVLFSAF